jgi:hypothetical protein
MDRWSLSLHLLQEIVQYELILIKNDVIKYIIIYWSIVKIFFIMQFTYFLINQLNSLYIIIGNSRTTIFKNN